MLSDIACDVPTLPAHVLMCATAATPTRTLWRMGRLDDLARVCALKNATGQDVDRETPPRDEAFLAARDACTHDACTHDACTDVACLCRVLIRPTNDSLGGSSSYPQ